MSADLPTKAELSGAASDSRPVELAATLPPPAPEQAAGEWQRGSVVDGRYEILEKLGEGGMGAVFLAQHLTLRKPVALKTIHASLAGHAEIAARFAREAMASARIEHPGVVSALDYGTLENGGAFLVMQFVRGEGMRQRLVRDPVLPWPAACELLEQIADAVAAAHAVGIVHRDLKPENVVLEPSATGGANVKVLDFGIAHLRADARTPEIKTSARAPLTQLGTVMGTPGYMAPEQAVGQPVDERADVYALGVMLWECLAGRQPFTGDSLTEIITKQFAATPPALPPDAQGVPAGLSALLACMLAPQLEQRVASAVEVRDRLRALRLQEVATAETRGRSGPGAVLAGLLGRFPARVIAAAVAAVLLLVALLFSLLGSEDDPATSGNAPVTAEGSNAARGAGKSTRAPAPSSRPARAQERSQEAAAAAPAAHDEADEPEAEASQEGAKRSSKRGGKAKRSSDSPKVGTRIKRSLDALFK